MSVDVDAPRTPAGEGFSDAVTFAFGEPHGERFGIARLGLAAGQRSGLAIVFDDGVPVAVVADSGDATGPFASWDAVTAAGLRTETIVPHASWRLAFDGAVDFDLTFEATSPSLELSADDPAARAGGMEGFDHICRVHGTLGGLPFDGLGQRSRAWGSPDWDRMELARTVSVWLDPDHAVTAIAVRRAGATDHGDEAVSAFVFDAERDDASGRAVADPRLSTTYDGEGRQRRAGLELYVGEGDEFPRRLAGEAVAGTSLDLGRLRLHCAFFRWRMEGRIGIGRYDILQRV